MFQRCAQDGEYEQAIGIALESRRLDVVKAMIEKGSPNKLLSYVLDVCMILVQNLKFRNQVLRLLVEMYHTLKEPDYISISQCLVHLNDHSSCTDLLKGLVEKENEVLSNHHVGMTLF
jgi:26S proteasome regulatory subunit N2